VEESAHDVDVLVVGSGVTGLTVATMLGRAGIRARIVEKRPQYFQGSRGKGTGGDRVHEVWDDLGIVDAVLGSTNLIPIHGHVGATRVHSTPHHIPTPTRPYFGMQGYCPQSRTEQIYRSKLAEYGISVELGTELVSLEQDADGVDVLLERSDGTTEPVRAKYVAACDGSSSRIRRGLGIRFAGETLKDTIWLIGDVEVDGLDRSAGGHLWGGHGGSSLLLVLTPFSQRVSQAWQYQATLSLDDDGDPPPATLETMQQIVDERTGRSDIRLHDVSWISHWGVTARIADKLREGRVFLAGEAAHVQPGGGLVAGILDGYNLGWKLACVIQGAPDWILDTYDHEQWPADKRQLDDAVRLLRSVANTSFADSAQRRGGDDRFVTESNQELFYRHERSYELRLSSPLSVDWGEVSPAGIRAGDTAPDAPCEDPVTGEQVRLFDLYRGPHWTLLGFGPAGAAVVAGLDFPAGLDLRAHAVLQPADVVEPVGPRTVIDRLGHAHGVLEVAGDALVLVRPDNHVGLLARPADVGALDAYFDLLQATDVVIDPNERPRPSTGWTGNTIADEGEQFFMAGAEQGASA
jgi:2-polyprenyl-6-methoxyphenol hydroxylase-like FAD-dependent oxidoreductase